MMNSASLLINSSPEPFDLFRLSKSKAVVDVCPNTLRAFHRKGLPFYRRGRAVFVSRSDLASFIRSNGIQGSV